MKVINLDREPQSIARLLRLAKRQAVVLTRRGKPLAALVDVTGEDLETLALRTNPEFQAYLQQCRDRHHRDGGARLEDVRSRYGLPPRAKRAVAGKPTRRSKTNGR